MSVDFEHVTPRVTPGENPYNPSFVQPDALVVGVDTPAEKLQQGDRLQISTHLFHRLNIINPDIDSYDNPAKFIKDSKGRLQDSGQIREQRLVDEFTVLGEPYPDPATQAQDGQLFVNLYPHLQPEQRGGTRDRIITLAVTSLLPHDSKDGTPIRKTFVDHTNGLMMRAQQPRREGVSLIKRRPAKIEDVTLLNN